MNAVANGIIISWTFISSTAPKWIQSWYTSAPTIEETIARLEHVRQQVSDREEALRKKMEMHKENAMHFARQKQVREARVQIRLRLLYDRQVMAVQKILTAIESHLIAIQSALLNREVFLALHDSSRALGKGSLQDDAVDDVLDRLDEQHGSTEEIMDMISTQPLDASTLTDDDVERELRMMMAGNDNTTNNNIPCLPEVPSGPIEAEKQSTEIVGDSI